MSDWEVVEGDCLDLLPQLRDCSVDSIVTDPPAGIGFMGKTWDGDKGGRRQWVAWLTEVMEECYRVLKPGGHALVWALPRTSHWTGWALEDAGFEVRDSLHHVFGTGFPKSLNVGKAIDKAAGAERTEAAKHWEGWGTSLKPAHEVWWLVRKPLEGTVAANVLEWGTGGINVDACRVWTDGRQKIESKSEASASVFGDGLNGSRAAGVTHEGRWPPNLLLTHSEQCTADECVPGCPVREMGEQSKFFPCFRYQAKSPRKERNAGLPSGEVNRHPTVKSLGLMDWLCRLITPPGGLVVDPFCGSGSTGCSAVRCGFQFLGFEQDKENVKLARERVLFWSVFQDTP